MELPNWGKSGISSALHVGRSLLAGPREARAGRVGVLWSCKVAWPDLSSVIDPLYLLPALRLRGSVIDPSAFILWRLWRG